MKKIIALSASATFVALAAAGVTAQEDFDHSEFQNSSLFGQLDIGFDGYITREEAEAIPQVYELFDELDTAGDGVISPEEFEAIDAVTFEMR